MLQLIASAILNADGGGGESLIGNNGGFSAIVRNGMGDYTLTLANGGVDATEAIWSAQAIGQNADNSVALNQTSDTSVNVFIFVGGAASDAADVSLKVERRNIV